MIGTTISHYEILSRLGAGGMGVVYRARDIRLDRLVALKFLPPELSRDEEAKRRFMQEAKAASALNHPGICAVYDVDEAKGEDDQAAERLFIVMPVYDGETLRERLKSRPETGGLPIDEAVDIAAQVAEALGAAHRRGIVHRDIKPANVMITDEGHAIILDFGLAKLASGLVITRTGSTLGTTAYMAPEQIEGGKADERTDVWSLGVVLYEMLTGRRPFEGDYEQAVVYAILNRDPEPLPDDGSGRYRELSRIVNRALAKDPDDRYPDMDSLLSDLQSVKSEAAHEDAIVPRSILSRSKTWLVAAILLVVAVALLYSFREDRGGSSEARAAVAMTQTTFASELERFPAFAPNGEEILFSREVGGFDQIFRKHLANGAETQLTTGRWDHIQPAWGSDGTVVLVRSSSEGMKLEPRDVFDAYSDGQLWSIDLESGASSLLLENAFNPSFSPDGSRLAFDASLAGPRRIWVADRRGRNTLQISFDSSEAVRHVHPRWSPDGSSIVFQNIESTKTDIKVVDVQTRSTRQVTDDLFRDLNPVWSTSGDYIYFSSYRSGGLNVWRIPIGGGGVPTATPQQITTGAGQDVQLAVAPNGSRLALTILEMNADLWRLPVSPTAGEPTGPAEPVVATTREDSRGSWSPDSRKIAFNSDRSGDMNLWIHDLETGSTRQLTKGTGGDFQARWSADGTQLVFFSSRAGSADIWVVDVEAGQMTQLTDHPALDINPFFSPDGSMIAFQSDRGGRKEVWVMNSDGSNQRQITNVGAADHFMLWTSDSRAIIFSTPAYGRPRKVSIDDGTIETMPPVIGGGHMSMSPDSTLIMDASGHKTLHVSPVDGGDPRQVFSFDDPEVRIDYPSWSPDGKWVLFDAQRPKGGDIWLMEQFE